MVIDPKILDIFSGNYDKLVLNIFPDIKKNG